MRAGTLKNKIVIEAPLIATNEYNEETQTWDVYLITYAEIKPLKGTETYYNAQLHATATHTITFRLQGQIQPDYRVNYNDRIFKITSVLIFEAEYKTQLMVEEIL